MPAKAKQWMHIELSTVEYTGAWRLQQDLQAARIENEIETDVVLSLEHAPVFTLGRRGKRENLKVSDEFLKQAGVPVIQVERGGDITFHGPGQLVVYPIINLDTARLSISDYITLLEEAMIKTVARWTISATRSELNRGIWVEGRKMGSIGIAVRRGVTLHGLALNVNLDLEPFGWINPCGLHGIEATSMKQELSRALPMDEVHRELMRNIEKVFGIQLAPTELSHLQRQVAKRRKVV